MSKSATQKQLAALTKLQLVNLYGLNVYHNLKDPKEKKKKFLMGIAYVVVAIMMMSYVGGLTYGYVYIGLANILPAYLIMLTSLIILMFSVFKAGDIIFQKNGYDILSSLPLKNSSIVISRFIRLYAENILLAFGVMIPAIIVFGAIKAFILCYIGLIIGSIIMFIIPNKIAIFK